jgi:hypothetical protein
MKPLPDGSIGKRGEAQLFLLRLWVEELPQAESDDEGEALDRDGLLVWHGKLQHVVRGEAHSFTGWEMMRDYLEAMLLRDLAGKDEGRRTKDER